MTQSRQISLLEFAGTEMDGPPSAASAREKAGRVLAGLASDELRAALLADLVLDQVWFPVENQKQIVARLLDGYMEKWRAEN